MMGTSAKKAFEGLINPRDITDYGSHDGHPTATTSDGVVYLCDSGRLFVLSKPGDTGYDGLAIPRWVDEEEADEGLDVETFAFSFDANGELDTFGYNADANVTDIVTRLAEVDADEELSDEQKAAIRQAVGEFESAGPNRKTIRDITEAGE